MFAFALWDERNKKLLLARDRLGKKPLCYYQDSNTFAFASEIKAILKLPDIPIAVNADALDSYMWYQYVPPPESFFKNIYKLKPAEYLIFKDNKIFKKNYWTPKPRPIKFSSYDEASKLVREEVEKAVLKRLVSDVPLGAFLSGGVDSSIVTGIMAQHISEPVKTFSIGFKETDFSEISYAKIVATKFKTDHHEFIVKPDVFGILPKLVWHYNEPFADSSSIPTYYVANKTRDYVKVALTGDGGDEVFFGYHRYIAGWWMRYIDFLPYILRRQLASPLQCLMPIIRGKASRRRKSQLLSTLHMPPSVRALASVGIMKLDERQDLLLEKFKNNPSPYLKYCDIFENAPVDSLPGRLAYVDMLTYLPHDILVP
jgi:asparagine synthase (glutamine-hydrolysing)